MTTSYASKSTNQEIRERFDNDVERFSNLDTGQLTTIDAPLTMELCTDAARYSTPDARELLDLGCGAGNYTIKMLSKIPNLNCTLCDLSAPMLERAHQRVSAVTTGTVQTIQEDLRNLSLSENKFDIILAAAVLHHLREDADWEHVFHSMFRLLKPGGSLWISDLITHDSPALSNLFQEQYNAYLETLGGAEYRDKVTAYIDHEDSPRSLNYQLDLMRHVGFTGVEVLHKHGLFAAFGGRK